jgi:hypothetical protein
MIKTFTGAHLYHQGTVFAQCKVRVFSKILEPFSGRRGITERRASFTLCGLAIRDTAGWQPALHLNLRSTWVRLPLRHRNPQHQQCKSWVAKSHRYGNLEGNRLL